ncbi:hypothetical protein OO258_13345 [Pseudomonas sp. DCB_BI]|uniref:hypothetical protein n=1 Tax=Pseudomonas sp. DCB_BI TaxID=2993594 RepID=UPI00224AB1FC|nr:hypothetical protein [Pseudomonas sp. DCB_BI]MCX2889223.1 hypothetical protein [Pseudomonas sp. DCB_BI]
MSVIAIIIEGAGVSASTLVKLHRVLGVPLLQLKSAVLAHEPVLELEIFDGGYQERAKLIRSVCAVLNTEKVNTSYYEIPSGQQYAGDSQLSLWKIDSNLVGGILSAADDEVERQLNS